MKPKPLVALNHFTVPMLTGVVPSQEDIVVTHFSGGLVRSNFWKGRQRLNRLYRWIANVVRPKIDWSILCEAGIQNNPEVHDFLIEPCFAGATVWPPHRHAHVTSDAAERQFSAQRRRNWPRGGAPRGAAPPGRSSLWRNISRPFSRS